MATPSPQQPVFNPLAGILAWILPGLGYLALGEKLRAVYALVGVGGLLVGGLLIGGVDSVDSKEDRYWAMVQFAAGPSVVAIDRYHQRTLKPALKAWESGARRSGAEPPYRRSVARVNETGMLYIALAGMLNIILVIDCATRRADDGHSLPLEVKQARAAAAAAPATGGGA